jgi:hypothetical protein
VTSSIQDLLKTATSPFSNVANGTDQQQLDWFINNTSSGLSFPSHSPAYVRLTCSADADQLCSAYTVTDGAGGSYSADEVLAVRTGDFAYSTF